MIISVTPVPKPRMTQRDKWAQRPAVVAYRAFADAIRAECNRLRFELPDAGAVVVFHLPMPKSWSKKDRERMRGQPHRQKPDLDNLVKAVCDALRPDDDSGIWQMRAEKRWGDSGAITITLDGA